VVKLLVDRDDVEADSKDSRYGRTPLSWAARYGHEAVVKLLVNRDDIEAGSKDRDGRTPLSWAAEYGHEIVVKLLQSPERLSS
jgi:ankyrin repeat protein